MQAEWTLWLLCLVAGAALGTFFYYGLWWTVRRVATAAHPGLLSLASFAVRAAVVLGLLWYLTKGRWDLLAAALAGFILARIVAVRRLGPMRRPRDADDARGGGDGP